ncbi:dihydroxy-acid dehydratase [Rhodopirellula sp.]|nr:dihydroxy-acid dehydratase [Rhodopirellula sp.]
MTQSRDPSKLRSHRWFGPDDMRSFGHRSRLKAMGFDDFDYKDRPVVAILNTWSELNTCHSHFRNRAEEVRRGILQSGGFPVEVPVMSLGEMLMKPTTMLYRNLLAMEVEEVLRCHPIDAAVLMGGCDKTVPAMLMGAISANVPSIFMPAGPMLTARWKDVTLGSGSDVWKYWDERLAGNLCDQDWKGIENCIGRSAGTCMTMGTASTMACVTEAMGFSLPGAANIPAVVAEHSRLAVQTGRRAVEMAWEDLKPSDFMTEKSIDNGLMASLAIGGSTNAIVHLIAIAGRLGTNLSLDRFDELSRSTPVLADIRPSGRFLMEDFFNAGSLSAMLARMTDLLNLECLTVSGATLAEQIKDADVIDDEVIRTRENPVAEAGGTCLLRGNLAPNGRWIKYEVTLPDVPPAIRIAEVTPTIHAFTGQQSWSIASSVVSPAEFTARVQRWNLGVKLFSVTVSGRARIRLNSTLSVGFHANYGEIPPGLVITPNVQKAELVMEHFEVDRVSKIGGDVAEQWGELMEEILIERLVKRQNKKLVSKLNKSIDKERDDLRLSLSEWFEPWTGGNQAANASTTDANAPAVSQAPAN